MMRKLFLSLMFVGFVLAVNAQTADEILNKYFANTGGVDKWKAVKTMKMEAKVATPQGDLPIVMLAKAPNKSKMTINVQGKEIVQQAYDGQTAWTLNPFA